MLTEVQNYIAALRDRRADLLQTLTDLNGDALNWRPLAEDANSLYALAVHSLGAERRWVHEWIGGRTIDRDRAAEFRARGEDVPVLRAQSETVARDSEAILAQLTEPDLEQLRGDPGRLHSVRYCIVHVLEHYNEHLGQMRLTRQLWENRRARPQEI